MGLSRKKYTIRWFLFRSDWRYNEVCCYNECRYEEGSLYTISWFSSQWLSIWKETERNSLFTVESKLISFSTEPLTSDLKGNWKFSESICLTWSMICLDSRPVSTSWRRAPYLLGQALLLTVDPFWKDFLGSKGKGGKSHCHRVATYHSPQNSPDFSLIFPWHFTVFHTFWQIKKSSFILYFNGANCITSKLGVTLKERICSSREQTLSFKSSPQWGGRWA